MTADADVSLPYKFDESSIHLKGTMAVYVDEELASGDPRLGIRINKIPQTFLWNKKWPPIYLCSNKQQ